MNIAAVILLLGLLVNPLTSLAKQDKFPQSLNALIAIVLAAVGGLAVVLPGTGLHLADPAAWAGIAGAIYSSSQTIYHTLFHDSPLDRVLTAFPGKPAPLQPNDSTPIKKGGI